jgi:MFS family permease
VPLRAGVDHELAERVEDRARALEVALLAADHDRERGVLGLRARAGDGGVEEGGAALRHALADRAFMYFLGATLCMTWIEFQLHSTLPLHIASLGFSAKTYGSLISINGVMIVLFELALTSWTQRFPPQPLIALGYGLTAIGFALTGLAAGIPMLAATVVIWTMGEMVYAPVTGAFVTGLAPERFRGRYMGLFHSTWSLGMLLGPVMGTWLYERGPNYLWGVCLLIGTASVLLALVKPAERAAITPAAQSTSDLGT